MAATLVLDRTTPMDTLFSFFGGAKRMVAEAHADRVVLSPVIDPDDYETDAEYLAAIPGMMDSIIEAANAPKSERKPVPKELFNVSR